MNQWAPAEWQSHFSLNRYLNSNQDFYSLHKYQFSSPPWAKYWEDFPTKSWNSGRSSMKHLLNKKLLGHNSSGSSVWNRFYHGWAAKLNPRSANVQVHKWITRGKGRKRKTEVVTGAKLLTEILHLWYSTKYSCLAIKIITPEEQGKEFVHGLEGKVQLSGHACRFEFFRPREITFLFKYAYILFHKKYAHTRILIERIKEKKLKWIWSQAAHCSHSPTQESSKPCCFSYETNQLSLRSDFFKCDIETAPTCHKVIPI